MTTYSFTDVVKQVAQETETPTSKTKEILESFVENIINTIKDDNCVTIFGFGRFGSKTRKAHEKINPRTKQRISIKEKKHIYFRSSLKLRNI